MGHLRFGSALLLTVSLTGQAFAADAPKKESNDACAALPAKVSLEGGKYVLERKEGSLWKVTKGSKPPRDFVYVSGQDKYRFEYRTNRQYRCFD